MQKTTYYVKLECPSDNYASAVYMAEEFNKVAESYGYVNGFQVKIIKEVITREVVSNE